ncbi:MAG: peptidase M23 [Lachnoclostridium sp.]|nr:peptidase M23 [Lachnoclostridium sp.]
MKKKKWIVAALTFVCCALAAFPSFATKSGLTDAKKKKTAIEQEMKRAKETLAKLEALKGDAVAYVKQMDATLETLSEELSQLSTDIEAKEEQITITTTELQAAEATAAEQYDAMKLRIKYMYEKGDSSYVDLLLQARSLSELLNKAEYIGKISEYDRVKLDEFIATKEQVAETKAVLETEHAELLELREQTEAKHASVEELLAAKQAELKAVESKIDAAEADVSAYQKDLKKQEDSIKAIEAEIRRQEEAAKKKAESSGTTYKTQSIGDIKFIWPCPASGRITSKFGSRTSPTKGASSNHQGIDIGAATGSNILAAAGGTVVVSTYSYSAGNYVMINHGGGVYTVYMHASKLLCKVGDTVKQGQVIAKVGSTGYSTGPHLHFGIRVNGTYVNPSKYVSP